MAIAKDQVPAALVEIVVMLAPGRAAPFAGAGGSPGVPLGVKIHTTGILRFIPVRVHQNVVFLDDNSPGGVVNLGHGFIQDQLADYEHSGADRSEERRVGKEWRSQ